MRKRFRSFSLTIFYCLSFILVVVSALISINILRSEANRENDFNFDSAVASAKREVAAWKNSHKNPADSLPASEKHIVITGDEHHPQEIHDSLFSFEIHYDSIKNGLGEWQDFVRSVNIFHLPDHKKIQVVYPPEKFPFESYRVPVIMEDMNYDGYTDFRVMTWTMTRGQTFYDFWLYDPAKEKFVQDTFMSNNLWDAEFDPEEKTVISNARLAGPFSMRNEIYSWENGKLILQEYKECEENPYGENGGDLTMKKRIGGKMITRTKYYKTIPITQSGQVIFEWDSLR